MISEMFSETNDQDLDTIEAITKQVVENIIHTIETKQKTKKKLTFCTVDLYMFNRTQGFECIPSDSNNDTITLGMERTHVYAKRFESIDEYLVNKRTEHLYRLEEEKNNILKKREEIENIIHGNNFFKSTKTNALTADMLVQEYTEEEANKILKIVSNKSDYEDINIDLPVSSDLFSPILSAEQRFAKLIEEGFSESEIDKNESKEILEIQESREIVGCKCGQSGLSCGENKKCSCWSNGIGCQVDKQRYPCCCSIRNCKNEFGLKKFDHQSVLAHYEKTLRTDETLVKVVPTKPIVKRKRKKSNFNQVKKRKVK